MRVDIIVPDFDDSSNEVTLSSWYKKVGDKIFKNEVIADAETSAVACGITSSYDCILAKLLVNEGEVTSQGAKIAIIETDLNADTSDIVRKQEQEEAEEILSVITPEIQEEEKKLEEKSAPESYYSLSVTDKKIEDNLEEKIEEEILEEIDEQTEEIIEDIAEHTEEKCLNILKNAETQAKEEAQKIKDKILEDAQKLALSEAEELKAKILKECEEKALKDAGEMHQKIVQGSLQEAEDTRAKLIEEYREKALQEAAIIKEEIIENAEKEAKFRSDTIIEECIFQAKNDAKQQAESISKNIIENAIEESKSEAKAIKKDIIHSARKYAAKESESIVKDVVKNAKIQSHFQAKELIDSTTQMASHEAQSLKKQFLEMAHEEIRETTNSVLNFFIKEITGEINRSISEMKTNSKNNIEEDNKKRNIGRYFDRCTDPLNLSDTEMCTKLDDLRSKASEKDSQIVEQREIINKLLNIEKNNDDSTVDNWNKPQFFESPDDYNEPIDILKRRISEKMKDSYDASVISTVSNEVDMSAVLALEKAFGKEFSKKHHTRLGFTPFFVLACIAALKQYRVFNAHIHNNEIIYKNNFDISIVTCGNDGIAAPVIRHANTLTIAEIEKSMISLSKRAIEGTLSLEEVSGGTFTVINAGIYGSLIGTDLLTPPQVATLSVHKMHNRPIATDRGMEVKPILYISLSYDHRISDTRKASEFLSNIKNYVENPGWQSLCL